MPHTAETSIFPVLALYVSAAGGAEKVRIGLVEPLISKGWRVAVTATPTAYEWLRENGEAERLAEVTGYPVRHRPRLPSECSPHPEANCIAAIPASANTVAKMALGICDNQALTHLCEALGQQRTPIIIFPRVSLWNVKHPSWDQHIKTLEAAGATLLYGEDLWKWIPPGEVARDLPWDELIAALEAATRSHSIQNPN